MASDFVLRQTSTDLQNDLNKIERMLEVRSLGNGLVLDSNIRQLSTLVTTADNDDAPFEIADDGANTILRIDNDGELITKAFDSRDINQLVRIYYIGAGLNFSNNTLNVDQSIINIKKIYTIGQGLSLSNSGELSAQVSTSSGDGAFELADENGNVALRITDQGHLLTKEFDSEEVGRRLKIYSLGAGLNLSSTGELSVTITGGVTDVRVDGTSVVSNTIANIVMPVKTEEGSGAFEIADQDGNVALQITSEGHLKTKEFDSSNINILPETVNDRYLHTNATTGELEWSEVEGGENKDFKVVPTLPVPDIESPKVVYNLLDGRLYILDLGGSSSSIVGVGLVGYMLVG